MAITLGTMVPGGLGIVANVTPGTPVQFTASITVVKQVIITPMKATGVANTGNVYIGVQTMNRGTGVGVLAVLRPGDPPFKILRGDSLDSSGMDLSSLWMDANTAADAVQVGFIE